MNWKERERREWLCKRIDHGDFLPTLKSISTTLLYVSCDTNSCNPNTENELTITILLTFKSLSTKLIYIYMFPMIQIPAIQTLYIIHSCVFKSHSFIFFTTSFLSSPFGWLVADDWCWFVLREEYCWLVASGWFVLREKYFWLVADKPSEQAVHSTSFLSCFFFIPPFRIHVFQTCLHSLFSHIIFLLNASITLSFLLFPIDRRTVFLTSFRSTHVTHMHATNIFFLRKMVHVTPHGQAKATPTT
jgi:hypothetical protein